MDLLWGEVENPGHAYRSEILAIMLVHGEDIDLCERLEEFAGLWRYSYTTTLRLRREKWSSLISLGECRIAQCRR